MEWWNLFFKVRKTIYAFISIVSFIWALVLSVYIARAWPHSARLERGIILGIIGANVFTAVLLYLMIVVYFRWGLDFARVLFLLLIHVGCSLALTLFKHGFSCTVFATQSFCNNAYLTFIIISWAMTGLLLGYISCLFLMLRVPRPLPKVTPNLLLDDPEREMRKRESQASVHSVNSTTGLLRRDMQRSGSAGSTSNMTRPVSPPRAYYVANMTTQDYSGRAPGTTSPRIDHGGTRAFASTKVGRSFSRSSQGRRQGSGFPVPELLPLQNPFDEPLPRNGSPESVASMTTLSSDLHSTMGNKWAPPLGIERYAPLVPLPQSAVSTSSNVQTALPTAPSPPSYTNATSESPTWLYSAHPNESLTGLPLAYYHPQAHSGGPTVWSTGAALRGQTSSPHSVHSIAPSMHLTHDVQHSALPQAHLPAGSDPVWRPHTASPPMHHSPVRPPMVGGSEVRRFGSVPNASHYAGQGGSRGPPTSARNAAHLAGALGATPPRSESVVTSPEQWRQLVMQAATGSRTY